MHFARVFGAQSALPKAHIVSVEADLSRGLHAFSIVGLPDKAVEEARDRVAAAIKNSGLQSPKSSNRKIVISLAPASLKKEGSAFDVPIALAYLLASEETTFEPEGKIFAGELSLDGTVRPICGALSIALAARDLGFHELYLPAQNAEEASLVSGITIYGISSLHEVLLHLKKKDSVSLQKHVRRGRINSRTREQVSLDDIRGQDGAKRALEIAVAGMHNIALYGPPGTGKTMLARAAVGLLPDLSEEEVIEVTSIHSFAGLLEGEPVYAPPFRSPHHTSSYTSLIGGGTVPRPGEVTLAHRGVLFLDEFPEFTRDVINALREPLEDRQVSISRVRGAALFPANFMLIAALNPCPCGKYGTAACTCMPHLVEKYRRKISGPIADRIDLWVSVADLAPEHLSVQRKRDVGEGGRARARIAEARKVQCARFVGSPLSTNADMGARHIEEYASLEKEAEEALIHAAHSLRLSARGYHRTIKLARTVADLAGSVTIKTPHMLEALQYRQRA